MTMIIEEGNLSIAWSKAYEATAQRPLAPLLLTITGLDNGPPQEDPDLRSALDDALERESRISVQSTANTIFPCSLWNKAEPKELLFSRFNRIWPQISRCPLNKYGHYFRRMTAFGEKTGTAVNQLDHVIKTWLGNENRKGNHRKSALQAAIFDPKIDHTHQPVRGFPCLQQVAFLPAGTKGKGGLTVVGFYPSQYIFDRAYGNYLGLCRLGAFMAHEMQISLRAVTCIVTYGTLTKPDQKLYQPALVQAVRQILLEEQRKLPLKVQ